MRLVFDRYRSASRSAQGVGLTFTILGALASAWGLFFLVVGIMMVFMGNDEESASGPLVALVFGALPLAVGLGLLPVGIYFLLRFRRLRRLAMALQRLGSPSRDQLQQEMKVTRGACDRILLDASERGVIDEGEEPPPRLAPSGAGAVPPPASFPLPPPGVADDGGDRPSLTGALIGGAYAVEGPVAAGAMGQIYAARQVRTGKRYAIKTLLPDARTSAEALARFQREASTASALGHPGIVAVHDFDVTPEGIHFLVMDYLEGESLASRLEREGALPWPEARRILLEVGSAVAAAHEGGVLHRDLTPANVFLAATAGAPARALLIDFGLAKPLDETSVEPLTRTGVALGTPLYMAPEQARGEALDVRADIYGLGAVLYEAATGYPPFIDRTLAEVYARLLSEAPAAASTVAPAPLPEGVDGVLARALAKSPDERFDTVRAMLRALEVIQ